MFKKIFAYFKRSSSSTQPTGWFEKVIVENLPDGVFVKDRQGRYLFANEYVQRLFRKEGEPINGFTDFDMLRPAEATKIQADDREVFRTGFGRVIDRVKSNEGYKYYQTYKVVVDSPVSAEKVLVGYSSDVTSLKLVEKKLEKTNALLTRLMTLTPHLVFVWDLELQVIAHSNPGWQRVLGYPKSEPEEKAAFFLNLIHPAHESDLATLPKRLQKLEKNEEVSYEWRIKTIRGRYKWCRIHCTPFGVEDGKVKSVMAVLEDIDEIKLLQEKYKKESRYDALTGLANRRAFELELQEKIRNREDFCVLYVDLDKFKEINDTHGHEAGDAVLVETARRLQRVFRRRSDLVARLGGDEFVAIAKGHLKDADNNCIPDNLQEVFAEEFVYKGQVLEIVASFGLTNVTEKSKNFEAVLHRADQAMYTAKKLKKSGIVEVPEDP